MTDADRSRVQSDLAFLRELVDEGDSRGLLRLFGATYVAVGVAIFAQVTLLYMVGVFGIPNPAPVAVVIGVWTVYSIVQSVISSRFRDKPAVNVRARASLAGLVAMTLSHFTMLIVFAITAYRMQDGVFLQLAVLVFFALQGGLWISLHALQRLRWHLGLALGWFAATLAAAPFLASPEFGLIIAIIVLVLMVAPGIQMLRQSYRPD
jgi:hypothetical protein